MALKTLLGKLTGKSDRGPWQPPTGPFPRLMLMDTAALESLRNTGGVYALWHRGVRPQWIYVGHTENFAEALLAARDDPDLALYDRNEGVFVSWAECPTNLRAAAVVYLRGQLEPAITASPLDDFGPVDPETKPLKFPLPVD